MAIERKREVAAEIFNLNLDPREGVVDRIRRRIINGIRNNRIQDKLLGALVAMYCLTNPDMNRR
jgi:hypothetical protein